MTLGRREGSFSVGRIFGDHEWPDWGDHRGLLKRGLHGTHVSVEPFHLFRYIDEQAFRYNAHKLEGGDSDRFKAVLKQIVVKLLTYEQLTGKLEAGTTPVN